jgi:capsular exopolysaccharide synthesis family protein
MRCPSLTEKLPVSGKPGLSGFLSGQSHVDNLIQLCGLRGSEKAFHVITAGQNPPNPMELLSSVRMKNALMAMREVYDYVILDLPPVGEVGDALAIAKETDGMLLVVRQNYCDRNILADTARQFDFINSKILGVVFNCTSEHSGNYGKGYYKHYYKRYYKRYYRGYSKSYENNDRSVASSVPMDKR